MTLYAAYDTAAEQPTPVTGFYDTEAHEYPNLPPVSSMIELTQAEWSDVLGDPTLWGVDTGALVKLPRPPPTADEAYYSRLNDGIGITSTGTPANSATYSLQAEAVALVGSIARDASSGMGLPEGATTVAVRDINGDPHDFTEAGVISLYKAARDLTFALATQRNIMADGGSPEWPPQTATIP